MIPAILLASAIASGLVLLQSNVLSMLAVGGIRPDLALIVIVYFSNSNGSIPGQITGFAAGIVKDLVTLSPLGFHALIYATVGLIYGGTKDKVFMDPILVPMLIVVIATIAKGVLAALLGVVFGLQNVAPSVLSVSFLIEIGLNAVLTPIFFAAFRAIPPLKITIPGSSL